MAKVRLQYSPSKSEKSNMTKAQLSRMRYTGAIDVLTRIAKEHGISGWYKGMRCEGFNYAAGMSTQILKAVLAQAILFSSKERFNVWTLALFRRISARK
jgi:adenine nucleotide transporter 17